MGARHRALKKLAVWFSPTSIPEASKKANLFFEHLNISFERRIVDAEERVEPEDDGTVSGRSPLHSESWRAH